jgi:hypothetical protein
MSPGLSAALLLIALCGLVYWAYREARELIKLIRNKIDD